MYVRRKAQTNPLDSAYQSKLTGVSNNVTVCVGKDRFPANRMVLASTLDYFKNLFEKNKGEKCPDHVQVEEVDSASLEALIEFVSSGRITVSDENVNDFLAAASLLQIKDVNKCCFEFLNHDITVNNCFSLFKKSVKNKHKLLEASTLQFIEKNFEAATATKTYKHLPKKLIVRCISQLKKTSLDDTELCKALIEWMKCNEENRTTELPELFFDVPQLPRDFLDFISEKNPQRMKKDVEANEEAEKETIVYETAPTSNITSQEGDNGKSILSLGGYYTPSGVVEVYNCTGEPRVRYPDPPDGCRNSGGAVVLNGYLYYVAGIFQLDREVAIESNTFWRLKLTERSLGWEEMETMKEARESIGATLFQGDLVISGGLSSQRKALSSGERYSPSANTWEFIAPLLEARCNHGLVACRGRLYAIGGSDGHYRRKSSVERLKTDVSGWEYVAPMQTARSEIAAVCYNDCIYAIGGDGWKGALNTVEKYDPDKDEWSDVKPMRCKRAGCSACVLRGKIYVVGGCDEQARKVKLIERYAAAADKWKDVKEVEKGVWFHSVVVV